MLFGSMYITNGSKKRFDTFCVMFYLLIRGIKLYIKSARSNTHEKNSQKKKRNLKTVRAGRSVYHAWRFIRPIDRCGVFLRVAQPTDEAP